MSMDPDRLHHQLHAYVLVRLGRLMGRVFRTDGSGTVIVQYTYNNLGQLQEKLNGNGTFTTYAYDAAGDLTSEINYAGGRHDSQLLVYLHL